MKSILLTFKNIKKLIVHHPVMFLFLAIVQVICCIAIFIVCGMVNNMYYVEEKIEEPDIISFGFEPEDDTESYILTSLSSYDENGNKTKDIFYTKEVIAIDPETGEEYMTEEIDKNTGEVKKYYIMHYKGVMSVGETREKLSELSMFLENDKVDSIMMLLYANKDHDLRKVPIAEFWTIMPDNIVTYDFPKKYYETSDKIFLANLSSYKYNVGDILNINGDDYKCAGDSGFGFFIPYNALNDDFAIHAINIAFDEKIVSSRLNEILNKINELFGTDLRSMSYPEAYDPLEKQMSEMVYIISLVVMAIILLAVAKFYNYILSDRQESLTILRLCGGTRGKVHIIYMVEIFLTMIITSSIGLAVFKFLLFDSIAKYYPSFIEFYTPKIYIEVFVAYIVIAMIIMAITVIPTTKATVVDMKRRK